MSDFKAKTIYLHLGTYKTASSFLQHILWHTFGDPDGDVYYPRAGAYGNAHHYLATDEFPGWSNGVSRDEYAKAWEQALDDIRASGAGAIVISSEMLCSLSLERIHYIRERLGDYPVRAVIYLRRQDQYVSSLAAQLIKGCNGNPEYYSDLDKAIGFSSTPRMLDYQNMCAQWTQVLGTGNLLVRPFEPGQLQKGEILADFFHHLLGRRIPESVKLPDGNLNPRLCRDALEFKLLVNRVPVDRETKNAVLPGLYDYSRAAEAETQGIYQEHTLLSPSQRQEIIQQCAESNAHIARAYLGREDGVLFKAPMVDSTVEWRPYPGLNTDTFNDIVRFLRARVPDVVELLAQSGDQAGCAPFRLPGDLAGHALPEKRPPRNEPVSAAFPVSQEEFFRLIRNKSADAAPGPYRGGHFKRFIRAVSRRKAVQRNQQNYFPPIDKIVDALSSGLISRKGETAFADFKERIVRYWPDYAQAWSEACISGNFSGLPKSVRVFLDGIKSNDIADEEYPLFRTIGNPKNSFCDVRLLKSLAALCAGRAMAPDFLCLFAQAASADPLNYLNYTALAQLLLESGAFRKAADFALEARQLRANDLCTNKTVVKTQKALIGNQLKSDLDHVLHEYQDRFCSMPFTSLTISETSRSNDRGWAFSLCPAGVCWTQQTFEEDFSWTGSESQEFRASILDGSFRYCDELKCPLLLGNSLPRRSDLTSHPYINSSTNSSLLGEGPTTIGLAYDRTCNLSCPSCRGERYAADKSTIELYNKTMDAKLPALLTNARNLTLSHVGEALASPHFRRLLKSITPSKYPGLSITLKTNLKLVSEKTWNDLGDSADSIRYLELSIDGATPPTLEKLRRGLKWDRLLEALAFVRELRKKSKIERAVVVFVIQKDNFRELPQMLELCSRYYLDTLNAVRITAHGSYTNDEMKDIDVAYSGNPLHAEYIDVVKRTKALHEEMVKSSAEILAAGNSVPHLKMTG